MLSLLSLFILLCVAVVALLVSVVLCCVVLVFVTVIGVGNISVTPYRYGYCSGKRDV